MGLYQSGLYVGSITAAQIGVASQEARQRLAAARLDINPSIIISPGDIGPSSIPPSLIAGGKEVYRGSPLEKSFKAELQHDVDKWLSDVKL